MKRVKLYLGSILVYFILSLLIKYNLTIQALLVILVLIPYLIKKYRLFQKTQIQKEFDTVHKMDGYEFEYYLKKLFKSKNYKVKHTPLSNDQGADLIVEKDNITTVIQAKRYSKPVGNKAVQEVIAAKQYYNCHKVIVITNNTFTKSAKDLARKCRVELFDYEVLKQLV